MLVLHEELVCSYPYIEHSIGMLNDFKKKKLGSSFTENLPHAQYGEFDIGLLYIV